MTNPCINIWTDGGCVPNPGIGGWGAVICDNGTQEEISGSDENSTNNAMELTACIRAIEHLEIANEEQVKAIVHSDSKYVVEGITTWIHNWRRKGFMRKHKPMPNQSLWMRLDILVKRNDIQFVWVKGHDECEENNRADELCTIEINKLTGDF